MSIKGGGEKEDREVTLPHEHEGREMSLPHDHEGRVMSLPHEHEGRVMSLPHERKGREMFLPHEHKGREIRGQAGKVLMQKARGDNRGQGLPHFPRHNSLKVHA